MNTMNNCPFPNGQGQSMGNYRGNMNGRGRNRQAGMMMGNSEAAATMERYPDRMCMNDPSTNISEDPLYGMPVGMGYVPWQQWGKVYDPPEGLANGTIFPELNLQFCGCIPKGMTGVPQGDWRGGRS